MSQSIARADSGTVKLADDGLQWLDELLKAEAPPDKPAVKGPPPLPRQSVVPTDDAIEVDIRWLVRVPSREGRRNSKGPPRALPSPTRAPAPGERLATLAEGVVGVERPG